MIASVPLPVLRLSTNVRSLKQKTGSLSARGRLPSAQTAVMAYSVTFKLPDGEQKAIEVDEDTYILDAADDAGLDLPYSCRSGTCSTCATKIVSGEMDQSDQQFLDEEAIGKGYALICVGYARSDVVLETHKEEEVMG